MKKIIRVGTRESKLAIAQSQLVVGKIKKKFPHMDFEIVGIKTTGDMILNKSLDKIGGKGLFIKELECALLEGKIDFAVHSVKDIPVDIHENLEICAISKREDPRDVLICNDKNTLHDLKKEAVIGTSSKRRQVQILEKRQDVIIKPLRGNVITRIRKLRNNEYDGIVLALAGLKRLGLEGEISECFSTKDLIPAVGQGALGIEVRKGENFDYLIDSINDEETALAISAERAYMIKLNGNCSIPIGAYAEIFGEMMKIHGMLYTEENKKVIRAYVEGNKKDAVKLGEELAEKIINI